jgi:hypothetical protein
MHCQGGESGVRGLIPVATVHSQTNAIKIWKKKKN